MVSYPCAQLTVRSADTSMVNLMNIPRIGFRPSDFADCFSAAIKDYGVIFAAAYVLTFVVYSYLFTSIIFTNHTFPNAFIYAYPSYKTLGEGRWFADMLISLFGGAGIQSLEMIVAAAVQVVNGILFSVFVGLKRKGDIFLATAFICVHPTFLDYYSFAADHIAFTLGDTLALMGALALQRDSRQPRAFAFATFCFVLSLAAYQPKIALIALLLVLLLLQLSTGVGLVGARPENVRSFGVRMGLAAGSFVAAVLVYFASTKLTIAYDSGFRTHLNGIGAVFVQLRNSYSAIYNSTYATVDYLPRSFSLFPTASALFGIGVVILTAWRRAPIWSGIAAVLVVLIPPALKLAKIINDQTWDHKGRIEAPVAYASLFLLAAVLMTARGRTLATALLVLYIYFFAILGSQETNTAAFKSMYDLNRINRIVARAEPLLLPGKQTPVVVIGDMNDSFLDQFRQYPNTMFSSQVRTEAFASYRQVEIMNFFLGHYGFARPTTAEVKAALAGAAGRKPWPDADAVYFNGEAIVIILGPYVAGTSVTWASDGEVR